jgi:hypothetical protein
VVVILSRVLRDCIYGSGNQIVCYIYVCRVFPKISSNFLGQLQRGSWSSGFFKGFEEKRLQWIIYAKRTTRRRAIGLISKEQKPMLQPRRRWFSQVLDGIRTEETADNKRKGKDRGKK